MTLTPEQLRLLPTFEGIPRAQLEWFCERGDEIVLAPGEHMFELGEPARWMYVVVEGVIRWFEEVGGQWLLVATTTRGQVTGMLPFSRMTHYPRYTVAAEPSRVLRLDKEAFQEMLGMCLEMGKRLVAEMSDRVRGDVRLEQQREKMQALGRLSAGLAHELNNPAAALRRATALLEDRRKALDALASTMVRHRLDGEVIEAIDHFRHAARPSATTGLSPLDRSLLVEDVETWLENNGVPEPWEIAATLVDFGYTVEALEELAARVPQRVLGDAVAWVGTGLGTDALLEEIHLCAERVSEVVSSVKSYSHMDRSTAHEPTDVPEGIDHTLSVLGGRIREQGVRLRREYEDELPPIPANAGELNQAWTLLIENALDAMSNGGELQLRAQRNEAFVEVQVVDDGPGIPPELRSRVFEPFFTTKTVGEGTGLGLDIALRIVTTHQGHIDVESRPGRTAMLVRLPI